MMKRILVVRHADAEALADARAASRTEAKRRLTSNGARRMRHAARGLRTVVADIDLIAASPLTRTQETAEILARTYPEARCLSQALLAPGVDEVRLFKWVVRRGAVHVTALVGHEPDLSAWIGYVLTGESRAVVEMKKGSICCLEIAVHGRAGSGRLLWLLTSKQLGRL